MKNYLEWLAQDTPTRWWHDSAIPAEIDAAIANGALGVTNEMPLFRMIHGAAIMGLADGPTEVHKVTVARQVLRDHRPSDDLWPTEYLPKKTDAARARFAEYLEHEVGNL